MKVLVAVAFVSTMFAASAQAADPAASAGQQFMPPMIPHPVESYLPITPEKNMCLMCHKPGVEGQKKTAGMPTALPPSHVEGGKVAPNRWECMLCHAPVDNGPKK